MEGIRTRYEESCRKRGTDPAVDIESLTGPGASLEDFWSKVKKNLQAGRIRMVFVADVIPPELRRIVEFLNGQMDPVEVLAVEIKQFVGQGLKTLVPRVIGLTAEAERKKTGSVSQERQWDEESFFDVLQQRRGDREANAAREILTWAKSACLRVWWGKGSKDGSFAILLDVGTIQHVVVSVWSSGKVEIPFQWMKDRKPFDKETKREELRTRLNAINGVVIAPDTLSRRPNVPLAAFTDPDALQQLLSVLDWSVSEVRAG